MFASLVADTPIVVFPILGLILFFTFMVGVYVWIFLPGRTAEYEKLSKSVFGDEQEHHLQ